MYHIQYDSITQLMSIKISDVQIYYNTNPKWVSVDHFELYGYGTVGFNVPIDTL